MDDDVLDQVIKFLLGCHRIRPTQFNVVLEFRLSATSCCRVRRVKGERVKRRRNCKFTSESSNCTVFEVKSYHLTTGHGEGRFFVFSAALIARGGQIANSLVKVSEGSRRGEGRRVNVKGER